MASTYTPIATQTLGSTAATVTFSSISGTYTDLVLVASSGGSTTLDMRMQFNSDTGTNYSRTYLSGDGTSAFSGRASNGANIGATAYASITTTLSASTILINIMNYSNTTTYKTALSRANTASLGVDAVVGMWRNTAAISTISLNTSTGTFSIGSTFTLYGIKAA
jgi:hypothetical protein